ncbi:MAG: tetratricopeptide repeat protein [Gammaproteobacteria bacterium]|nr:tetratricopeptide repeat protein [Gammaproteobacteria bacterium]NNM21632.1 tetratricopeptide repeat protein [Gammaproteobacteria bacterium]
MPRLLLTGFALPVILLATACAPSVDTETRLQIALENERRGEPIAAILELKNILQSDPQHLPSLVAAGRLSLQVGRSADAVSYLIRAREEGAADTRVLGPLAHALLANGEFERLLKELPEQSLREAGDGDGLLLRGEALIGLGQLGDAERAFRLASETRGSKAQGLSGLARVAMIRGELDKAERLIEAALDRDPFSVSSFRALGALRHEQGRYEEAEQAFTSAVEATAVRPAADELLLARVGLAESQWRMGETGRALGNVKDLLDAYPWHPLPRYLRALLAYDDGEYLLAADYLREVRLSVPQHRPTLQLLAACEFELGNFSDAELILREYLATVPRDVEMRRLLARTHLKMGNPTGAMAALLPVVELAPEDEKLLALLGRASLYSGDAGSATAYLNRAVEKAPEDDSIRVSLVVALIGTGQTETAERHLAMLPDTDTMRRARSLLELVLLMRKAESERALLYAKQLRQAAPTSLHAMLALAELAESRNDPVRAIEWLEMARSRNPGAIEPRLLLVRYYGERDNHQRAHDIAVEAVQIRPHQADALVALAMEKLALGQLQQADTTFAEALRAAPESAAAYLGMTRAAVLRDDIDQARDLVGKAITLDASLMPQAVAIVLELAGSKRRADALQLADHLQSVAENLPHGYAAVGDLHMAQQRFGEALTAYESAMQRSDDPVIALKTFIAAREAGSAEPGRLLRQWLAAHPGDESVRKMLDQLNE